MKKDWTEIVKDKLSESAVTPPDSLWEGISSELDAKLPKLSKTTTKVKPKTWLRWTAAACLVGVIGSVAYYSITNQPLEQTSEELIAHNAIQSPTSINEISDSEEETAIEQYFEEKSSKGANLAVNNSTSSQLPKQPFSQNPFPLKQASNNQSVQNGSLGVDPNLGNGNLAQNTLVERQESDINGDHDSTKSPKDDAQIDEVQKHDAQLVILDQNILDGKDKEKDTDVSAQQGKESYLASTQVNPQEDRDENRNKDYNKGKTGYDPFPIFKEETPKRKRTVAVGLYASNTNFSDFSKGFSNSGDFMYPGYNPNFPPHGGGEIDNNTPGDGTDSSDMTDPDDPEKDNSDNTQSRGYNGIGQYGQYGQTVQSRSSNEYKITDAKHRQPLRFGLSLRYSVSSTLSLNTGLVYSLLSSTLTWSTSTYIFYETDQTLNYLGIPLSIEYKLPSLHKVGFYLTLGGMIEKCIYGKAKNLNIIDSYTVSERAFQISAFAGAGVEFNLNRNISIYVEPLATYYFDNHSDIVNIYKDRKLNFDLRLGLRWSLK